MKICTICGRKYDDNEHFCRICGKQLTPDSPPVFDGEEFEKTLKRDAVQPSSKAGFYKKLVIIETIIIIFGIILFFVGWLGGNINW